MIREAQPADLQGILALLAEDAIRSFEEPAAPTARQRAALDELIADPAHEVLVDERDGRLVATAQVSWLRVLIYDGGLICQIESVRTASDLRGQGIGKALMEYVVDRARERGCARIQLTTNSQRIRAHQFYERLGFTASHVGMKLQLVGADAGLRGRPEGSST
ncbi:GNAT family N-acetyltransferase [Solicola gregarius]|uniref:GNAT family N-acetyltransferase n=1 Tax=Solicola gregarius TaxID=2908642 RepID=A0AA46YMF1_9ACTN|nr:GNAT family N-acetyltransferase [Solicola gregarius]UYM06569.1 GNAT family N-acetyltransferase [Solicola gregarius]